MRPALEERSKPHFGGWRLRTPAEEIWRKRGLCVARWGDSRGGGDLLETPARSDPAAEADRPGTLTRREGPEPRGRRWKVADAGHRPGKSAENSAPGGAGKKAMAHVACGIQLHFADSQSPWLQGTVLPLRLEKRSVMLLSTLETDPHPTCLRHPVLTFLSPFCSDGMLLRRSFHLLHPGT